METRSGDVVSLQAGMFEAITNLDSADFKLEGEQAFQVKNENDTEVLLEVLPASGTDYVAMKFYPGWNVEIVKAVKQNVVLTADERANLKYGF
ncbi:MAG: hypothetical protein JXR54_06010 [Tannerellaceae bacterium]|nr:hypothetical protein [Tannerellaceae bacterium]